MMPRISNNGCANPCDYASSDPSRSQRPSLALQGTLSFCPLGNLHLFARQIHLPNALIRPRNRHAQLPIRRLRDDFLTNPGILTLTNALVRHRCIHAGLVAYKY